MQHNLQFKAAKVNQNLPVGNWVNLHARLRYRELHLFRAFLLTMALLLIGLIGTFPPVYQLFR